MDQDPIQYILDDNTNLFNKYRALYFIRNSEKLNGLEKLILSDKLGALFKHEVFYLFYKDLFRYWINWSCTIRSSLSIIKYDKRF